MALLKVPPPTQPLSPYEWTDTGMSTFYSASFAPLQDTLDNALSRNTVQTWTHPARQKIN
eukprot:134135-Pelagomonas_calceolata.AAC.1